MKKIGSMLVLLVLLVVLVLMIGAFANFASADEDDQWTIQDNFHGVNAQAVYYGGGVYRSIGVYTDEWSCSYHGEESPCLRVSATDGTKPLHQAFIPYQHNVMQADTITLQFEWDYPCQDETSLTFSFQGDLDKYMTSSKYWQGQKLTEKSDTDGQRGWGTTQAEVTFCDESIFTITDGYGHLELYKQKRFLR